MLLNPYVYLVLAYNLQGTISANTATYETILLKKLGAYQYHGYSIVLRHMELSFAPTKKVFKDKTILKYVQTSTANACDLYGNTALMWAISNNADPVVYRLLSKGAKVNTINANGMTALHFASYCPKSNIYKELIRRHAQIDAITNEGVTPLMLAAVNNHRKMVQDLLNAGCSINRRDYQGDNAIKYATIAKNEQIVRLLMRNGAKVWHGRKPKL